MALASSSGIQELSAAEISVFLNCPFDVEYEALFDALVFSILCCGFTPRIATETDSVATPRIERLCHALHSSRYSIHDLSRCHGEGDHNIARFNMPLELGIAMGRRYATAETAAAHDWLALVPKDHSYAAYISDLAGFDPKIHDGTQKTLVPAIMSWLLTRSDAAVPAVEPIQVLEALPKFEVARRQLRARWVNSPVPWRLLVAEARSIIAQIN